MKKSTWVRISYFKNKYSERYFWSNTSQDHFIKNHPLISEEWISTNIMRSNCTKQQLVHNVINCQSNQSFYEFEFILLNKKRNNGKTFFQWWSYSNTNVPQIKSPIGNLTVISNEVQIEIQKNVKKTWNKTIKKGSNECTMRNLN